MSKTETCKLIVQQQGYSGCIFDIKKWTKKGNLVYYGWELEMDFHETFLRMEPDIGGWEVIKNLCESNGADMRDIRAKVERGQWHHSSLNCAYFKTKRDAYNAAISINASVNHMLLVGVGMYHFPSGEDPLSLAYAAGLSMSKSQLDFKKYPPLPSRLL